MTVISDSFSLSLWQYKSCLWWLDFMAMELRSVIIFAAFLELLA